MPLKYSATTVFLPHLTLSETAKTLRQHGYNGVELRVRYYTGDPSAAPSGWGRHVTDVSPDNVVARASEIRDAFAAEGIAIAGCASNASAADLETVRKLAAGAAACGCPAIRLVAPRGYDGKFSYQEGYGEAVRAYAQALAITRDHGIKVWIELHGGTLFVSASLAHRLLCNFNASEIGAIYDPQNMCMDGFETTPLALDLLGDYVAHVHAGSRKPVPGPVDAKGTTKWQWVTCPMGEGLYDHTKLLAELVRRHYPHFITLEDFDDKRSPEQRLHDGISYMKAHEPASN
jgi:sugar phosphate isomerase/epimerase